MKDKKALVVTTALFVSLLFLSSTASEQTKKYVQPAIKKSPNKSIDKKITGSAQQKHKSTKSLHKRLDRFADRTKDIDCKIATLRSKILRTSGQKRTYLDRELRRLEQRRNRIAKRMKQIAADIERIEGTKIVIT